MYKRQTVHGVAVVVALVLATFVQSISVTVPVLNSVYCTPTSVNAEGSMLAIEPPTVAAVSYTHLDVYKRQSGLFL